MFNELDENLIAAIALTYLTILSFGMLAVAAEKGYDRSAMHFGGGSLAFGVVTMLHICKYTVGALQTQPTFVAEMHTIASFWPTAIAIGAGIVFCTRAALLWPVGYQPRHAKATSMAAATH